MTTLGTKSPLPVEVAQFGYEAQEPFLRTLGAQPKLRMAGAGMVFVTDNGNFIYDCHFPGGIKSPREVQTAVKQRAVIVETGLFIGLATIALIGTDSNVREIRP